MTIICQLAGDGTLIKTNDSIILFSGPENSTVKAKSQPVLKATNIKQCMAAVSQSV